MIPFGSVFREIAARETRSVRISESSEHQGPFDTPAGEYAFLEHYCDEAGCDCRRVMLAVVSRASMAPVAWISHSFDPPKPGAHIKEQTFLDPMFKHAPYGRDLMRIFLARVLDEPYDARLRRHYRMIKDHITGPSPRGWGSGKPMGRDNDAAGIRPPPARRGKRWK